MIKMTLKSLVGKFFKQLWYRAFPPVEIIRTRPMSDAVLLTALAVPADHPLFLAMLELLERARTEARSSAKAVIKSDRETVFALGQEYGLDQLESYLLNLRAEAVRGQRAISPEASEI